VKITKFSQEFKTKYGKYKNWVYEPKNNKHIFIMTNKDGDKIKMELRFKHKGESKHWEAMPAIQLWIDHDYDEITSTDFSSITVDDVFKAIKPYLDGYSKKGKSFRMSFYGKDITP